MKSPTHIVACSLLLLSPSFCVAAKKSDPAPQTSPTAVSPGAAAFLDNAIDVMRQHSLRGKDVDWDAIRTEAFKRAGGAFNPIDTYPAIYWALVQLSDPGSHLRLPPGLYPDQIALMQQAEKEARASAPVGTKVETSIPTAFAGRRLPEGHVVTVQGRNFGYIVLPRCSAKDNDGLLLYAADVRRLIADISAQSPKGWIVDLRGNTGGNMWPMLTGIGPILGDGALGSFVASDGNVTWFYQDGKTGTRSAAGLETVSLTLEDAPVLVTPSMPVAVLVDSSTASSAEAIAIAFHGRAETRFFGTRTAGKSTAVQPFKLDDGAELYLTTAIDADRTGKAYPDGFSPDEVIPYNSSSMPLESNDGVMQSAQKWLVVSTTPSATPQAPAEAPKGRRKKPAPQQLASVPAVAPPAAPIAAPVSVATAPAPAAEAPVAAAPVAPAPVAAAPAPTTPAPAAVAPAAVAAAPALVTPAPAAPAPVAPVTAEAAPAAAASTPAAAVAETATAPAPVTPDPAPVAAAPVTPAPVSASPASAAPAAAATLAPPPAQVQAPLTTAAAMPAPVAAAPTNPAPAAVVTPAPMVAASSATTVPASASKPKPQHKKVVIHQGS
jgi:carboxyl-terminal processing protease